MFISDRSGLRVIPTLTSFGVALQSPEQFLGQPWTTWEYILQIVGVTFRQSSESSHLSEVIEAEI